MLNFKPVELMDQDKIKPFFETWQLEGSELTFANLYIWQPSFDIQYCIVDGILLIKLLENGERFFLPPIPASLDYDYHGAMSIVAQYMEKVGLPFKIRCANTKLKARMEECCVDSLVFTEDRNNFDYIYLSEDLSNLTGKKYHAKRNHINKFLADYKCEYAPYDETFKNGCFELYAEWHRGKEVIEGEPEAVKKSLDDFLPLGLMGGVLLVDGKVEAFTIGEQTTDDMAVVHIEKAVIPGAFSFINQQFAEHELSHFKYVNREEDMGIEGLRKAKMSYNPVRMIEKYTVEKK